MTTEPSPQRRPEDAVDYESKSISRPEYIQSIVHLYRGELYRANSWRMRLDNTTNWAVLTCAGLLSFSFSTPEHSHWVLLVGMFLITVLHSFEARRFRFFDVWRYRVRMIEENFYGPILRRDPVSPDEAWGARVANDLLYPSFKITFWAAMRARFVRNYWVIYAVLVGSWMLKVTIHPNPAHNWSELTANMTSGLLTWHYAVAYVSAFTLAGIGLVLLCPRTPNSESAYWSPSNPDQSTDENVPAWDT